MQPTTLTLRRIDDFHHHFRVQPTLQQVLELLILYCGRAIVMPNLANAVLTAKQVIWYRNEFINILDWLAQGRSFMPLMTIAIQDNTTPEMVLAAHEAGAVAGKVYPLGVTTNSDNGLREFFTQNMNDVYRTMKDCGMKLLLHGEIDAERTLTTQREDAFLPIFERLVNENPDLKMVFEHVSTKNAVELIRQMGPNVAGTITAHHLVDTLNDVIGTGVAPHHMCMPVPKHYDDRDALVEAATSGNPKFFFGSDSAPHAKEHKECAHGKCGQFTVPHALCMLAEVFEGQGMLYRLEDFTSRFGANFYGLPLNEGTVTLEHVVWEVPPTYGDFVPPNAGKLLNWRIVST